MHSLTFDDLTYVVIYDDDGFVQYMECEPGTGLGTGQPYVEQFTNEVDAKSRAIELGYVFSDPETQSPE